MDSPIYQTYEFDPERFEMVSKWFVSRGEFKENLLWAIIETTRIRWGDCVNLKFKDVTNENLEIKESINKYVVTDDVRLALNLYLKSVPGAQDDYLFSTRNPLSSPKCNLAAFAAMNICKRACIKLGLPDYHRSGTFKIRERGAE